MNDVSYTALVLDKSSVAALISAFTIPQGWQIYCHHMTINMGAASNGPASVLLGKEASLKVVGFAVDDKVMAAQVETDVPSANKIKHVTVAVNRAAGGKPFHSNNLTNWKSVSPIVLHGFVAEVGRGDVILTPQQG